MLQNGNATTHTVSELLREKTNRGFGVKLPKD